MKPEKKTFLKVQGYRGTRDFYPADMRLQNYLYQKLRTVVESFGYEEYAGPFLEPLELYASKTSEEIVRDQLYSFTDRGDRTLAIRPEMTPTLARMIAAKGKELLKPMRWYSIPTCMRFERPQRGRLREFNQFNVDIFGGTELDEDIEILLTIVNIFYALGASTEKFEILVNHRGLANNFFEESLKISESQYPSVLRILDKKDKLSEDQFVESCTEIGLTAQQIQKINQFLTADISNIEQLFQKENYFVKLLQERIDFVNQITKSSCVRFAPNITRGFDYYTGMVFEVFDTNLENRRALFGGGRFDNLVSAFGVDALPGVGYAVSDVALINFMDTHKLTPDLNRRTDVCVLRFQDSDRYKQIELSQMLRQSGFFVDLMIIDTKFSKQIAYASRVGAKSVAFRGEEEIKNNTFCVKILSTGEQRWFELSEDGILQFKQYLQL